MSTIYNSSKTAETINRAIDNNMGTTTTEQGASSAGLIISEDLQPIVQCVQGFEYSISENIITGVPPLSFHAIAQHLTDWSIDGNTDGGESVGDKTTNLLHLRAAGYYVTNSGVESANINYNLYDLDVIPGETYTIDCKYGELGGTTIRVCGYDNTDTFNALIVQQNASTVPITFTVPENTTLIKFSMRVEMTDVIIAAGDTAEYEPVGYDVLIIANNTDTYHCYITDVLRKSSGETPVYDTMSSDGTIVRRVDTDGTPLEDPTTETYTAPDITVNWGWNAIDVDTTVTPSSMTINYKDD